LVAFYGLETAGRCPCAPEPAHRLSEFLSSAILISCQRSSGVEQRFRNSQSSIVRSRQTLSNGCG